MEILIAIIITRAEYDQRVHEYSSRYNQILDLNTSFHFQEVEEDNYLSTVLIFQMRRNSKNYFLSISFLKILHPTNKFYNHLFYSMCC